MGGHRNLPDARKTRIPDPGSNLSSETVSDSYLSTPDELEGDNMRIRKLKSRLTTLETSWDVYHKQQTSISNFGAPPRTTDRFAAHTHQNSDPAPRVKPPASTPTISPAHADGFVPLGDYVDRVRKGSFGVFTENPDSQGCRNQFLSYFSCLCMVFHRFQLFWHGF